jgi:type IV secretory pathway VirJ component
MTRASRPLLMIGVACLALAACGRDVATSRRDLGRLGNVRLFLPPARQRQALAFLISGGDGWSLPLDEAARRLAGDGTVVVGIDLPEMLRQLAASDDGCHYVVADLEAASRQLERDLAFERFRAPVLAGLGAGATFAYAALAQAPAATIAGAFGAPGGPALRTRVPLCPGAPSTPGHAGFTYAATPALPGWLAPPPPFDASGQQLATFLGPRVRAEIMTAPPALADLPLTEIPPTEPGDLLAIIYSGDGGWRDLDKTIGEALARQGVAVVGVDSLRYFWRERTLDGIASDAERIIQHYGAGWQRRWVMLVGYSFGADVLPFIVTRLPDTTRDRVVQVSLLGLAATATFEFRVGGWLGMSDPTARPVLPELLRVDPALVQCVYGADEEDTLCPNERLLGIERIRTTGGHHFDGDYAALARRILAGAHRRARDHSEQVDERQIPSSGP